MIGLNYPITCCLSDSKLSRPGGGTEYLMKLIRMSSFYAVRVGRKPGVYRSWSECENQVKGFPNSTFAKFATASEAEVFISRDVRKSSIANKLANFDIEAIVTKKRKIDDTVGIIPEPELSSPHLVGIDTSPHPLIAATDASSNDVADYNIIYTDGACPGNGTASAKAGYGVFWPKRPELSAYGFLPNSSGQTNQRAELTAVLVAVDQLIDNHIDGPVEIRTDSDYAVRGLTSWYRRWESLGWKVEVKNIDLFRLIIQTCRNRMRSGPSGLNLVYLRHIRGHSGDVGNDEADRLAVLGANLER